VCVFDGMTGTVGVAVLMLEATSMLPLPGEGEVSMFVSSMERLAMVPGAGPRE